MDQLSENFLRQAANIIHHSCKDQGSLIEDVMQLFQTSKKDGKCTGADKIGASTPTSISPSNKENGVTVNDSLSGFLITREDIFQFIKTNASQLPSKLWVLNEDIKKKLDVKDRVHPFFAGLTTPKAEKKLVQSPNSRSRPLESLSNTIQCVTKSLTSKEDMEFVNNQVTALPRSSQLSRSAKELEDTSQPNAKKTPSPKPIRIIEQNSSISPTTPNMISTSSTENLLTKSSRKRPQKTKTSKTKPKRNKTNDTPTGNSKLPPLVVNSPASETDNEQNVQPAGPPDEVIMQNLKFPNVLVTVERINARKSMSKTEKCTPTTSFMLSEKIRSSKPKGGKCKKTENVILPKSNMSEAAKNETPCSAMSNCDVIRQNKKRKFKGPAGRRIDSPALQPKIFADSSDVVVVPNPIKKESKKKKVLMEKENLEVASKTHSLTSFFSPLQNTSNAKKESVTSLTEEERRTKLVMIYTNRVERALSNFDKISMLKVIKEIVKLPEENIEKIANPFVKFVAKRECVHLKNMDAMKNMTNDEKRVYRKETYLKVEPNKEFEALILQFLSGKREDMLCELKPFYDVPLMKLCNSNTACALFGHCLSLTEFLDTFNEFLGHELSFSAEYLMDELKAGKSGFQGCIGYILKAFLHFLIQDGYKKKCKQLQSYAPRTYVPGVFGIFKLTQLVLLDDIYSEGSDDSGAKSKEDEQDTTVGSRSSIGYDANVDRAMQQLEEVAFFWNLAISSQVTIMEILQDKIIDSASFRKYLDSSKEIRARALQEKKDIEDRMQKVHKDIEEIQSHCLEEDMSCLTRKQTKELAENEKLKNKKTSELELLRDKLMEQDGYIQEAETISSYGQVEPLGYDRFYRRYWFFGNSPNRGIFIEQEASRSAQDFSEARASESKENVGSETMDGKAENVKSKKSFASFISSLSENLFGRPPDNAMNKKAEWRVIKTENELNLLLDCLGKGVREEKLAASIRHHLNDIILSLKEDKGTKANDDVQAVNEVDPLKSDSDAKAYQVPEVPEQNQ